MLDPFGHLEVVTLGLIAAIVCCASGVVYIIVRADEIATQDKYRTYKQPLHTNNHV